MVINSHPEEKERKLRSFTVMLSLGVEKKCCRKPTVTDSQMILVHECVA